MDIASFIGVFGGFLIMIFSILVANAKLSAFVDYPSIVCVVGGAITSVFVVAPLKTIFNIGKVVKKSFFNRQESVADLIELIVKLAEIARREGLLALESKIEEINNPFVVLGIQMAVDGTRPEVIEDILKTEMEAVATRHKDGKFLLDQIGKYAPAFGMIGTLIGLVIMLGNMSDPDAIGPGMAVALLTTLYGSAISNIFALPLAEKLNFISKQELIAKDIVVRGIMAIQSGDNPRVIQQKLSTFLPPKVRKALLEKSEETKAA